MDLPRINHPWALGDHPIIDEQGMLPWGECDLVGEPMARIVPAGLHEGSSREADRIISGWRERLRELVGRGNGLITEIESLGWEPRGVFVEATFLGFITPGGDGPDLRFFADQAVYFLLQVRTSEELTEESWWDERLPDARDLAEWLERLPLVFPKTDAAFRLWGAFQNSPMEAFFQYLHGMMREWYLEALAIVETSQVNPEGLERRRERGIEDLPPTWEGPKEFQWLPPRLFVEGREIWLSQTNAEQMREWGMFAAVAWRHALPEEKQDELVDLVEEADALCLVPRWKD